MRPFCSGQFAITLRTEFSPSPTKMEQGIIASAGLANKNWHFLVGSGKIDFAKSKKIVGSADL